MSFSTAKNQAPSDVEDMGFRSFMDVSAQNALASPCITLEKENLRFLDLLMVQKSG